MGLISQFASPTEISQGGHMNPELSYAPKPSDVETKPAPQNFVSRLIGVYFSPSETFAGMAAAPRALTPIIALTLLFLVSSVVLATRMPIEKINEDRIQQMVASGQISEQQAEQQREGMKQFAPFMKYVIPIT